MSGGLIQCVFDCNVFLQALINPLGPAGRCVQLALDDAVALNLSAPIIAEVRDVTSRPGIIRKYGLASDRVEHLLDALLLHGRLVDQVTTEFQLEADPDDAIYVNLALTAGATLIVSRDNDLHRLMDADRPEGHAFLAAYPALRVMMPPAFLREVESRRSMPGETGDQA